MSERGTQLNPWRDQSQANRFLVSGRYGRRPHPVGCGTSRIPSSSAAGYHAYQRVSTMSGFSRGSRCTSASSTVTVSLLRHLNSGLKRDHVGSTIEKGGLPPTINRHGLVASQDYTISNNDGKTHRAVDEAKSTDTGHARSPPGAKSQGVEKTSARQVTSAPDRQKTRAQRRPVAQPKVNTLVRGSSSGDGAPKAKRPDRGHPGKATNGRQQLQTATAWADARAQHGALGSQKPTDSKKRENEAQDQPDDFSPNEPSTPLPNKSSPPENDFSWRAKPASRESKPLTPEEDLARRRERTIYRVPVSLPSAKPKPATKPRIIVMGGLKPAAKDKHKKAKDTPLERTRSRTLILRNILPPRRERTRNRLLLKAKTEQQVRRSTLSLAKAAAKEDPEKYTIPDAVIVYLGDAQLEKSVKVADEKPPVQKKLEEDLAKDRARYSSAIDPLRNVPPWHQKEYVFNQRETDKYEEIHDVYGHGEEDLTERERDFYDKVEQLQIEAWRRGHQTYYDNQVKAVDRKHKQQKQLKSVRNKFDDEQVRRFRSQYVTSRVLEHEWTSRHVYGLPEDVGGKPEFRARLRSQNIRPKEVFNTKEHNVNNVKRYHVIFRRYHGNYDYALRNYRVRGGRPGTKDKAPTTGGKKPAWKNIHDRSEQGSISSDVGAPYRNVRPSRRRSRPPAYKGASDDDSPPASKIREHLPPYGIMGRPFKGTGRPLTNAPREKPPQRRPASQKPKEVPSSDGSAPKTDKAPFKPRSGWDFRKAPKGGDKGDRDKKPKRQKTRPVPVPALAPGVDSAKSKPQGEITPDATERAKSRDSLDPDQPGDGAKVQTPQPSPPPKSPTPPPKSPTLPPKSPTPPPKSPTPPPKSPTPPPKSPTPPPKSPTPPPKSPTPPPKSPTPPPKSPTPPPKSPTPPPKSPTPPPKSPTPPPKSPTPPPKSPTPPPKSPTPPPKSPTPPPKSPTPPPKSPTPPPKSPTPPPAKKEPSLEPKPPSKPKDNKPQPPRRPHQKPKPKPAEKKPPPPKPKTPTTTKRKPTTPKHEQEPVKPILPEDRNRPDVPSPELDDSDSDDDIFERAKRKYGIVLDSDDEK